MAGMTDTAFRRLVKRHGGCGLVVTEMVSSEGLVRGIDRTLEYAEYTEEERPDLDPDLRRRSARRWRTPPQIVEQLGADIVDVNMGCPVPKIAKHNAGCSLMREPAHAASRDRGDDEGREDPGDGEDACRVERARAERARCWHRWSQDAGAAAIAVHGRTAAQSYSGLSDWDFISERRRIGEHPGVRQRRRDRARAGHRAAANHRRERRAGRPRRAAQSLDSRAGAGPRSRAARRAPVTMAERGQFLLDYIDLLLAEGEGEAEGFRHVASTRRESNPSRRIAPRAAASAG